MLFKHWNMNLEAKTKNLNQKQQRIMNFSWFDGWLVLLNQDAQPNCLTSPAIISGETNYVGFVSQFRTMPMVNLCKNTISWNQTQTLIHAISKNFVISNFNFMQFWTLSILISFCFPFLFFFLFLSFFFYEFLTSFFYPKWNQVFFFFSFKQKGKKELVERKNRKEWCKQICTCKDKLSLSFYCSSCTMHVHLTTDFYTFVNLSTKMPKKIFRCPFVTPSIVEIHSM